MSDNKLSKVVKLITNRNQQRELFRQVSEYFQSSDTKHKNAWDSYGYVHELHFKNFYSMFRRFGIGHAAIMMTVDKCWQAHPTILESCEEHEQTAWELEFDTFCKKHKLFVRLKGLDWRQRLSRYAGLIMFVADDKQLSEPLEGTFKPDDLRLIRPVVEGQLYPTVWEEDQRSIRYGQPLLYQFDEQNLGDTNRHSGRSMNIHYTRVITWAEGADDGTTYGSSAIEPIFNSLVTLERLIGAGGTGFWKAARQSMQLDIDKDADLNQLAASMDTDLAGLAGAIDDQVDDFQRGFDKVLMMQGIKAEVFDFKVPDPDKHFNSALSDVAAGSTPSIPMTILIGQQTGRLASDEDQSDWGQSNESRRENFLTPSIVHTLERFIELGFLSQPKDIVVEWPPLLDPAPKDKLEQSKGMATVNKELLGTGLGNAFTVDEIRKKYDMEPLEDDLDFPEDDKLPVDDKKANE